ncbi:hypothetical protein FSP39_007430 [Pinctada imbricata]|uniref:G-protein coupled receptors family 1 profile domain-containing protein n=1 Tax=Pinctada imbricata TaxID=66713 RepID=A0AA88XMR4_PINIB|nr:hypothetical protein FSP39_007430 [Pinctada imbricata]
MEANASVRERIVRWNKDLQYDLIPNNLILALYIFLGIFGNSTVIYVYRKRFSRKNNDRYFIPILAAIDLFGSVICGSFGIALNMMQATFYNDSLCKTWWFFAAFITYESQLLLVVIAVQRYLKVVRPFGRHMDQKLSHIALLLTFIISLLLAIPTSILYGSVSFPHPKVRHCWATM